jgi:hypothetical protein
VNEFYVGYAEKASSLAARFVRRVVFVLGLLLVATALVLVTGQTPFDNSAFEYGKVRALEGIIETRPYPAILVARPGEVAPEEKYSRYLLVAPGKHGAEDVVARFDGKQVRLRGQLIYREGGTMIEVEPGSIASVNDMPLRQDSARDLGPVTVSGEIVDSKCYLGVMNPGKGKVHRDCAARCLSGGIPPLFITADGGQQFLLVGLDGKAIARDVLLPFVAEPVTLRGEVLEQDGMRMLRIDPSTLRHQDL